MRELPELRGEPVSFGGDIVFVKEDKSEVVIEKALDISDECRRLKKPFKVHIFYTRTKDGRVGGFIVHLFPGEMVESHQGFLVSKLASEQSMVVRGAARQFEIDQKRLLQILTEQAPK